MIYRSEDSNKIKGKALEGRKFIERDWHTNTLFVEGRHWVVYDSKTQMLRKIKKSAGEVQRTVNNARRFRDVMTQLITRSDPTVEVRYTGYDIITDELRESAGVINHLVREKWRTKHFDNMIIKSVKDSIMFSVGANELYWDKDAREGEGDVSWKSIDVWNLWFDPDGKIDLMTGEFDGDFILKSVETTRSALEANPKYSGVNFENKGSLQENDVKRNLDDILYEASASEPDDRMFLDVWYIKEKVYTDFEVDGEKFKKCETKFRIEEKIGEDIIYSTDCDLDEYPIKFLKSEVTDKILSRPTLSDQIEINKLVDRIFSSMEEYARTMIHGRVLKHAKTKVSTISTKSGQIINYDGARPPQEMRMSGIDSSLFALMEKAEKVQQDMARVSDGTLGNGNATSGLELGLRKAADLENASEPSKALSIYLAIIVKTMLKLYCKHLSASMPISYGKSGEEQIKNLYTEGSTSTDRNRVKIEPFDDIEVKIVPKSAFSDMSEQQDIMQLAQMGAVDRETIIESFMKGKTGEVLQRVKRAELQAKGINEEAGEATMEAQAENEALMNGKKPEEGKAWKSKEAQQAGLMKNAEFLQGLVDSKGSEKIINNATKLIRAKAKRYGIPMREQQ